jgi:hypothetical protein
MALSSPAGLSAATAAASLVKDVRLHCYSWQEAPRRWHRQCWNAPDWWTPGSWGPGWGPWWGPVGLNPQPEPPGSALNPQPLPPAAFTLNPQPLPPAAFALNPQPLPPAAAKKATAKRAKAARAK